MSTIQTRSEALAVTLLLPSEALDDPEIREEWQSLCHRGVALNRVFASPTVYEHATRTKPLPENRVAVLRDGAGKIIGICPVIFWRLPMSFHVRKHVFWTIAVKAATILSGEPLMAGDPALFHFLIERLFEGLPWCDCIYMNSVPVESFTCKLIYANVRETPKYLIHPRRLESREWIYLEPGESMAVFLEGKQKRTRNTLKRRVKKMREHGGGSLECVRVETPDQVDEFYESAFAVAQNSWQFTNLGRCQEETALYQENLRSLARLGALRAYLLKCGGEPCAFVIGYQYEDVLQFEQTAYSSQFASHSPGTVLYYTMLEDLYRHRPPRLVNYGVGVTPHKRLFSNQTSADACIYLFRPTLRNRLRCASHTLFYTALGFSRRLLVKKPSAPPVPDEDG